MLTHRLGGQGGRANSAFAYRSKPIDLESSACPSRRRSVAAPLAASWIPAPGPTRKNHSTSHRAAPNDAEVAKNDRADSSIRRTRREAPAMQSPERRGTGKELAARAIHAGAAEPRLVESTAQHTCKLLEAGCSLREGASPTPRPPIGLSRRRRRDACSRLRSARGFGVSSQALKRSRESLSGPPRQHPKPRSIHVIAATNSIWSGHSRTMSVKTLHAKVWDDLLRRSVSRGRPVSRRAFYELAFPALKRRRKRIERIGQGLIAGYRGGQSGEARQRDRGAAGGC